MSKPRLASLVCVIRWATAAKATTCHVVHVYDGDTLLANWPDFNVKVRLAGIDAPATGNGQRHPGQAYGQQAKAFSAKHVQNEAVQLKSCGDGRSDRVLSEVFVQGPNINLKRVKARLAEACRGKRPKGFNPEPYFQAEARTRKNKRGMG